MATVSSRFISFSIVHSLTESINVRLLLDRAGIPYRIKNEALGVFCIAGEMGESLFGPIEFLIPEEFEEPARQRINEIFTVREELMPEFCPACETRVEKGRLECVNCGLFLC